MKNHEKKISEMADLLAQGWYTDTMTCIDEDEWEGGRKIVSPIEQIFYAAWDYYNLLNARYIGTCIYLTPQKKVGPFYLDFEVGFLDSFVNHPVNVPTRKLKELSDELPKWGIEIDGHDFHEKTKEQVAKDKQRERAIMNEGYKIYRFSGSEVFKHPLKCVNEVYRPAEKIIRKHTKEIWGKCGSEK